jgi:YbbR domain-containing protein
VTIEARQLQPILVPIAVQTAGELPETLEVVSVRASPEAMTLLIEDFADRPRTLLTEPIDLARITGSTSVQTRAIPPPGTRLPPATRPEVTVHVEVAPAGQQGGEAP